MPSPSQWLLSDRGHLAPHLGGRIERNAIVILGVAALLLRGINPSFQPSGETNGAGKQGKMMADPETHDVVYITAGAAGMYCGSCMHDNTLVRALLQDGIRALLVPTYTPIRTDDRDDVSDSHVFLGGIHVYLNQRLPWLRYLPAILTGWLDRPNFIRWATRRGISISPAELGELTLSMLDGNQGVQASEFARLSRWLEREVQPRVVHFTNLLIGGGIPRLKQQLKIPIFVTLQGDDVFLEGLTPQYRTRALRAVRDLAQHVDQFLCYSADYADLMADYLQVPRPRIQTIPLGIDFHAIAGSLGDRTRPPNTPRRIGYLARLAPEKGLHALVDAFLLLKQQPDLGDVELHMAGWCGPDQQGYAEQQFQRLRHAGWGDKFRYHGSVNREQKLEFLQLIDLFSVPATFREPKGIYVLEALAAGIPVIQPRLGSFPELVEGTGGGYLVPPQDPHALAAQWAKLLRQPDLGAALGACGQNRVRERYDLRALSRAVQNCYQLGSVAGTSE